jgi:general secretion pathway protein L
MAATNSTFSPQAVGIPFTQRLSNFWRWWKGELALVTPGWLHSVMSPPSELANIYLDGRSLSTLKLGINSATPTNTVSLDEGEAVLRRLMASVRSEGGNVNAVRLVLPQAEVLRRRISLPLATEENLRQVVGFDLDRQTPFNAASAFYDVKIEQRDTAAGMLIAQLAATPKAQLETVIATLAKAGLTVRAIGVVDDLVGQNTHFDLFPPELRPEQKLTGLQIFNRVLIALVAVLMLAVVFIPVWQKRENVISLLPILEKAKIENEGTERVLTEVTRLATEYNFIATKKQTTQATVTLVEEFSKMLPDNTWVQTLEIKATPKVREVQVQGETASVTKLIELFEKSPLLQNTSTRSQVSRGAMPNTERFHIAAEIKPRVIMDEKTALAQGLVPALVTVPGAPPSAGEGMATAKDGKAAAATNPLPVVKETPLSAAKDSSKNTPQGAPQDLTKGGTTTIAKPKSDGARLDSVVPPKTVLPSATPNNGGLPPQPIATPLLPSAINGRPVPALMPTPPPPPDPSNIQRGAR